MVVNESQNTLNGLMKLHRQHIIRKNKQILSLKRRYMPQYDLAFLKKLNNLRDSLALLKSMYGLLKLNIMDLERT